MRSLALILALGVAGCAAGAKQESVVLPDGRAGFIVRCGADAPGFIDNADKTRCFAQAGTLCPNGYDIAGDNDVSLMIACKRP